MLKTCLIGISGFGANHYNLLIRHVEAGDVQLLAATVINQDEEPEKCARLREVGCELFTEYETMLARFGDEADVCFIPTGIHLHAPMTIAALRAGCNVFVEKPLAATIDEVEAMKAAEDETGRWAVVGYQTMYASETRLMKETILSGRLGELQRIRCRALWPRPASYYQRNNWAGKLRVGDRWVLDSPFNNALAHQLNMICFLAGKTFAQSAKLASIQAELYRANPIESADTASLRILTEDHVPLLFIVTHACDVLKHPDIHIEGSAGRMVWRFGEQLEIELNDGTRETHPAQPNSEAYDYAISGMADPGGEALLCDLEIAGTQTLAVNGAHTSSPVRPVPASAIEMKERDGSPLTTIRDIETIVEQAFAHDKLFSEIDVPWARPAPIFSLENYRHFTGPAPLT